jgi:DNA mismatch endonuclease (patch repair protein)
MDTFTTAERSQIMARIRSVGTRPEERLYALVRSVLGARRRVDRNVRSLPGVPDVYIPSLRLAVFVDGCYFHGCPRHCRIPATNRDYWVKKIERNRRRDRRTTRQLRSQGIAVWRFWEHEVAPAAAAAAAKRLASAVQRQLAKLRSENT